jgi:hypothetical protein
MDVLSNRIGYDNACYRYLTSGLGVELRLRFEFWANTLGESQRWRDVVGEE